MNAKKIPKMIPSSQEEAIPSSGHDYQKKWRFFINGSNVTFQILNTEVFWLFTGIFSVILEYKNKTFSVNKLNPI